MTWRLETGQLCGYVVVKFVFYWPVFGRFNGLAVLWYGMIVYPYGGLAIWRFDGSEEFPGNSFHILFQFVSIIRFTNVSDD